MIDSEVSCVIPRHLNPSHPIWNRIELLSELEDAVQNFMLHCAQKGDRKDEKDHTSENSDVTTKLLHTVLYRSFFHSIYVPKRSGNSFCDILYVVLSIDKCESDEKNIFRHSGEPGATEKFHGGQFSTA